MADLLVAEIGSLPSRSVRTDSATSITSDTASSTSSYRRSRAHRSNLSVLIDELNREVRSNSEESASDVRVTSGAEPAQPSFWTSVANVFKAIGTVCQVTCPPVPARIVRKVAFHPPAKNSGYRLQLNSQQHRYVDSAKEVAGKPFTLVPTPMRGLTHRDYAHIMERITATTIKNARGNDLVVIHVRCRLPASCDSMRKQVILMTQPNSSDLGHFLQPHCINFLQVADSIGSDLYAFDYSGFGYSTGYPSESNIYADSLAVFDHVQAENTDKSIVLLGYSIGTAAAVDVAYRKTPLNVVGQIPVLSGMILVAPFTSGIRLLSSQPTRDKTCCFDPFSNSEKIKNIDLPILIVHGTEDSMVPLEHSTALAKHLRQPLPPFIVQGADHQTVFGCNPSIFIRMSMFVRTETLVAKTCFNSQPVARSVVSDVSSLSEKSVPVDSRCASVVEHEAKAPSKTPKTNSLVESTAPMNPKETTTASTREGPIKTAQAKTPLILTARERLSLVETAKENASSPVLIRSAFYPCHTPTNIAEIEQMQSKIAKLQ